MNSIEGSRVLVIGGTAGIGRAVADAAASRGAAVIVASRSTGGAPEGDFERHHVDMGDPASVALLAGAVQPITHLVITAGARPPRSTLADLDPAATSAALQRVVQTLDVVRILLPALDPRGSIVLTGTTTSVKGSAGSVLAAAIGGALTAATRSLAVELAPRRINLVAPGVVRTGLWNDLPPDRRAELFDSVAATAPTGRLSEPEDVAAAYLGYLEMDQVTGQMTAVDGGATLV